MRATSGERSAPGPGSTGTEPLNPAAPSRLTTRAEFLSVPRRSASALEPKAFTSSASKAANSTGLPGRQDDSLTTSAT